MTAPEWLASGLAVVSVVLLLAALAGDRGRW